MPKLVKEGYVMKKSASTFVGWQKRFLQLYESKLIYLADPSQRQKVKGCISLLNYNCQVELVGNDTVRLSLAGIKRAFLFKSNEAPGWA
jgi:hypothetical protein